MPFPLIPTGCPMMPSLRRSALQLALSLPLLVACDAGSTMPIKTPEPEPSLAVAQAACRGLPKGTSSLRVIPATNPGLPVGATLDFDVLNQAGVEVPDCAIIWSVSDPLVAVINNLGVVVGRSPGGPVTVRASTTGKKPLIGSAFVTIVPAVASIQLTPSQASLSPGGTIQLTATLRDASGVLVSGRTPAWTSSISSVATVSGSGLVTAVGLGSTTITAMVDGASATAVISVVADLIRYYPFNGSPVDLSPSGVTGTLVGSISYIVDRNANPDRAISFSGGHMTAGPIELTSAFTVATWVRFSSLIGPGGVIIGANNSPDGSKGWAVLMVPCGDGNTEGGSIPCATPGGRYLRLHTGSLLNINASNTLTGTGIAIAPDEWHHLAVTFTAAGTATTYVDGVMSGTRTGLTPAEITGEAARIGRTPFNNGGELTAGIDEFRIYRKALSAEDVRALMTMTTP
jgi:hypothetical protein